MSANAIFMLCSLWAMVGTMIVWMFWTTLEAAIGKGKKKITIGMALKRFVLAILAVVFWPFGIILVSLWTLKKPRAFFLRLVFGKKKVDDRTPVRRHAAHRAGGRPVRHRAAPAG